MIGLLFLGVVALWFVAACWLARRVARRLPQGKLRIAAVWMIAGMLIALPLTDEVIGGFQLRALCKKNAVFKVDAERIRGKTVRSVADPSNKDVKGTPIRIYYSHLSYRDVETNEELASYTRYVAEGGWLIRTLSTDNHIKPLTFESTCDPTPSTDYGFKLIH